MMYADPIVIYALLWAMIVVVAVFSCPWWVSVGLVAASVAMFVWW